MAKKLLTHTGARRLLKLARLLEKVPPDKFSMRAWVHNWVGTHGPIKPGDCNTTACAMGWAVMVPELHNAGLRLVGGYPTIKYKGRNWHGYSAAKVLFGVTYSEAHVLFSSVNTKSRARDNETPVQCAKRIRRFVTARMPV